jgi:hypothetical protein
LRHGKASLALRGAGLFSADRRDDYHALRLRATIRRRKGADFLVAELRRMNQGLSAHTIELPDLDGVRVSPEELPRVAETASQEYLNKRLLWESLAILEYARPLESAAIMDPVRCGVRAEDARLSQRERRLLQAYGVRLETALLGLLESQRPDRGFSLLLATARHQLVQRSLELDRLLVLEPFSPDAVTIPATTVDKKRALMGRLATRARLTLSDVRGEVFTRSSLDEASYNRLENSAGRYYEIQRGVSEHRAVRVERRRLIPSRPRFVVASRPTQAPLTLRAKHAVARDNFTRYRRQVGEAYGFGLITRNCATELVRSINGAFPDSAERIDELGGRLGPGEALSFIPFRLFDEVQERLRVTESALLPSYRKRRLAQMYRQENPITAYLREFNTLSSTIYRRSDDDGAFLLFTDDVLWPRPLYGILNLAYGLVTAGVGALSWPLEGDRRIKAGFRGAFFSLPELVFANIRKGSFEFVSDGATAQGVTEPDVQEATFHRRVAP